MPYPLALPEVMTTNLAYPLIFGAQLSKTMITHTTFDYIINIQAYYMNH